MGTLQDALLEAGVVDQKEVAQEESRRRATQRQGNRRVAPGDERMPIPSRSEAAQAEADAEGAKLAKRHRFDSRGRANKRWYFTARSGTLRCIEIPDEQARELERGQAAIAESPKGRTWVVTHEGAEALEALDPRWIRFRVPRRSSR